MSINHWLSTQAPIRSILIYFSLIYEILFKDFIFKKGFLKENILTFTGTRRVANLKEVPISFRDCGKRLTGRCMK